jgi:HSP20 family protein
MPRRVAGLHGPEPPAAGQHASFGPFRMVPDGNRSCFSLRRARKFKTICRPAPACTRERRGYDAFAPAADLRWSGDSWRVSLALPGVAPAHVDIEIVGRTPRVRGERTTDDNAQPVINEIRYGRFEREFTVPQEIDAKHVQADYRHGMLELTLPLAEGAKPYRIAVTTADQDKQLQAA